MNIDEIEKPAAFTQAEWDALWNDVFSLQDRVRELERRNQELQQDLNDARNGWESAVEEVRELDVKVADQLRTIQSLMMGVEEHTGKEGTTPVLRYICELERQVKELEAALAGTLNAEYEERKRIIDAALNKDQLNE